MKKIIALFVIFVCVGTALSAQIRLSAGAGGLFGMQLKNFSYNAGAYFNNRRYINGGAFVFFDATYAEVDVGIRFGKDDFSSYRPSITDEQKKGHSNSLTFLSLGLLGKFPFNLGGGITLFPLAGVEYNLLLINKSIDSGNNNSFTANSRFNDSMLWLKFGLGADINITNRIFIRPSALYGFGIANEQDKASLSRIGMAKSVLNHGFDLRAAAGFRF